jgi:C_GCAxxG_C_C family probable redox protein
MSETTPPTMLSPIEQAIHEFLHQPRNCAQAVLSVFCERFGLDREMALALAAPFGAGIGRSGAGPCGAISGALLALGLAAGRRSDSPPELKEAAYQLAAEFLARFRARHGEMECRWLIGVDIGTPDGWRAAAEQGLYATVCPAFVRSAIEMVEEILS